MEACCSKKREYGIYLFVLGGDKYNNAVKNSKNPQVAHKYRTTYNWQFFNCTNQKMHATWEQINSEKNLGHF